MALSKRLSSKSRKISGNRKSGVIKWQGPVEKEEIIDTLTSGHDHTPQEL